MRRWTTAFRRLLVLAILSLAALWALGPTLVAPVADFPDGPGGAIAYISLYRQFQSQSALFAAGKPLLVMLTEEESSGMLRSAVLSGWSASAPPPRLRAVLRKGRIRLEMILYLVHSGVPVRFQGPVGLVLDLAPEVPPDGPIRFRIQQAAVGRIPLSAGVIRRLGGLFASTYRGFDPAEPALYLPVQELVIGSLNRVAVIRQIQVEPQRLTLQLVGVPPQ